MGDLGGIVASAIAGGVAGAGKGAAEGAKMDYESDIQRKRDEFLAQKQENIKKLELEAQATQGQLNRGSQESMHGESMALGYAGQASTAQTAAAGRTSAEKIAGLQIASHERVARLNRDLARESAKNVQLDDEGNLNVITMDADGKPIAQPVMDADGNPFKSNKDMTTKDQSRVKVLQALIKEDTDLLQKTFDPSQQKTIGERIKRYTKTVGGILGIDDLAGSPSPTGERKPLSSFMQAQ